MAGKPTGQVVVMLGTESFSGRTGFWPRSKRRQASVDGEVLDSDRRLRSSTTRPSQQDLPACYRQRGVYASLGTGDDVASECRTSGRAHGDDDASSGALKLIP